MNITKNGSQPSAKGPTDWFTGAVRIDSPFQRNEPARIGGEMLDGKVVEWMEHVTDEQCGR